MTDTTTTGGAQVPIPDDLTPDARRLIGESRALAQRIAAGERGPALDQAVDEWHRRWQASADPGHVGGGRVRT